MKLFQEKAKTQVLFNLKNQDKNHKLIKLMKQLKLKKVSKKYYYKNKYKILRILRRNIQAYKMTQVQF